MSAQKIAKTTRHSVEDQYIGSIRLVRDEILFKSFGWEELSGSKGYKAMSSHSKNGGPRSGNIPHIQKGFSQDTGQLYSRHCLKVLP